MKWVKKIIVVRDALSLLFRKPSSVLAATLSSILIFILFIFLNSVLSFLSVLKISLSPFLLWKVFINQVDMIASVSGNAFMISLIVIALFGGINIALLLYKRKLSCSFRTQGNVAGAAGVFGGALASACPACSGSLLSILGVSSGIAVFPLKGFEFIALSFLLLTVSLYSTSKKLVEVNTSCRIL